MEIDKLWVTLEARADKLITELDKAEKKFEATKEAAERIGTSLQNVGLAFSSLGTVIAASFSVAITNFIKASDEIDKMSKRTGLGVETLQELKYAADITGTSIGDLEIGIKMMQNAITDAANGSKSAIEKFDRLGINFEKIKNLSPEQQFMMVADAISKIQDPTERAAMAVDMFGRSGTQLLPLLEGGASGIQKLRDEAHIFGKVLDEETISKTVDLKDNIERLQYSFNALWSEISVNMLPIVEDLVKRIQSVISDVRNWINENPQLFNSIVKVVAIVGSLSLAIGGALLVLGKIISIAPMVASAWALITGPVGQITLAITGLIGIISLLIANFEKLPQIFQVVKISFLTIIKEILSSLEFLLGSFPIIGNKIKDVVLSIEKQIAEEEKKLKDLRLKQELDRQKQELDNLQKNENKKRGIISEGIQQDLNEMAMYYEELNKLREKEIIEEEKKQQRIEQLELSRMQRIQQAIQQHLLGKQMLLEQEKQFALQHAEEMGLSELQVKKYYADLELELFKQKAQEIFSKIQQLYSQVSNIISQYYKNKYLELDNWAIKEKEAIKNSALSEEEKAKRIKEIDEKVQKEKKKLAREQAEREKQMAIFSIIINTARAIVEALPNIGLAVAIGVLGAAQLALVMSQPLPEFAEGGLIFGETMAIVGEYTNASRNPEVIAPLDKLQDYLVGGEQTIIINLDGQTIAKTTAKNFPQLLHLYGAV